VRNINDIDRGTAPLVLAHMWLAVVSFAVAAVLGGWQMWARSPLPAPFSTPHNYFLSVTLHGTVMAYVLPTFFIMGFGYFVAVTALERPLPARWAAWIGFGMGVVGVVLAAVPVLMGRASVLYTFYPPLSADASYYIGIILVVVGSWIWSALMILAMTAWKRENRGEAVPLVMFATVANVMLWLWTTVGFGCELLFQVIPGTLGWSETVDVGLSRTLFSWTLHAIVYFWLLPAYMAFYTMVPRAAGGRLYSDLMGRMAFLLFLLYSLPVGMHHLFMDPEHGTGFKFLQTVLTSLVVIPTLMTVFTISASLEIAGRLRGGKGLLGWLSALPWDRPMVLAAGLSFVMLWFGGLGGLVNMSYGMNAMIHNTSWVTAHFHLIFGGTTVIMYFAIAYEIWPSLTGRTLPSTRAMTAQLWLWFVGMMVTTLPWHWLGLEGQWRRVAAFNYADPVIAAWGPWVIVSFLGGLVLVASALMFVWNLLRIQRGEVPAPGPAPMIYAVAVNPPRHVPGMLNGFATWNVAVLVLMAVAYGYPIAQFFIEPAPQAVIQRAR
jgi:cytochrome c oxidase subunit I